MDCKKIPGPSTVLEGLNLRELDIRGSRINYLAPVRKLALQRLDIHDTSINEIVPFKTGPVHLRERVIDSGRKTGG